jgi:flagellar basal body-associated protein FliL
MAQDAALVNGLYTNRVRVRTPGKYIVLFLFMPVILVALGAGLWLNMKSRQLQIAALEYRMSEAGVETAYYTLPEFLVDLSPDMNGRTAYLQMRASIVLGTEETDEKAQTLDAAQPAIVERLTFFLRVLRPEDFEGSDAQLRLKSEMARRINLVIAPDTVGEVVIEELVIQ